MRCWHATCWSFWSWGIRLCDHVFCENLYRETSAQVLVMVLMTKGMWNNSLQALTILMSHFTSSGISTLNVGPFISYPPQVMANPIAHLWRLLSIFTLHGFTIVYPHLGNLTGLGEAWCSATSGDTWAIQGGANWAFIRAFNGENMTYINMYMCCTWLLHQVHTILDDDEESLNAPTLHLGSPASTVSLGSPWAKDWSVHDIYGLCNMNQLDMHAACS